MNVKQRILSIAAIVIFALTLLFTPWRLSESATAPDIIKFAPLFLPPHFKQWERRDLSSGLFWSWLAIGVIFVLLYSILRDQKQKLK
jgi:hypothetical protein